MALTRNLGTAALVIFSLLWRPTPVTAASDFHLLNVPDYNWYAGCFGTANGNLFGFWDRNGFPDFYTGPTGSGLAPLDDRGANVGIRSMWASKIGLDGRPAGQPGHAEDYWIFYSADMSSYSYESTAEDPYVTFQRQEHAPDCIGDFIGLSQKKWSNMNGECDGNIDAYSFIYWDPSGNRRINYTQTNLQGVPQTDIQSGLRAWSQYRGYEADVSTQLAEFNPTVPAGNGFTFEDLKREITNGYPVMVFLQNYNSYYRSLTGMPKANPSIHGVLIYGYMEDEFGPLVRLRTSWASGGNYLEVQEWSALPWLATGLSVRGVILYHPKPKITHIERAGTKITVQWDGPASQLYNGLSGATTYPNQYVLEMSPTLSSDEFALLVGPTTNRVATVPVPEGPAAFFRVRLLENP